MRVHDGGVEHLKKMRRGAHGRERVEEGFENAALAFSRLERQARLRAVKRLDLAHMGTCGSRISDQVLHGNSPVVASYPRSEPICMTRLVADAASNSHPVAALLSAAPISRLPSGEGSGERNHSLFRLLEPGQISVRSPGSAGADRAPEDWRGAGPQAAIISAPSGTIPAVTYFQKAISSFRAKATISTFRIRPPLNWTL
jgi:hypothetical protein